MQKHENNQAPDQSGDVSEWLADSLVYIQNTTTGIARDFQNFQGRLDGTLEKLKSNNPGVKIDEALNLLKVATCDFNKAGYEVDQKRRSRGFYPVIALGVVLLLAIGVQTVVLSGGLHSIIGIGGLTGKSQKSLENCINTVRKNNTAYKCSVIVRPEDV